MKPVIDLRSFLLASALAVSGSAAAAKPGPEVAKLGYYVGSWVGHGATKAGPFGAAGKLSSHMTCSWFEGSFQVICKGREKGPSGTRRFLNVIAYDDGAKAYTEYSISSLGESEYDTRGSLKGDRLTYVVDHDAGGKTAKVRYVETHVSPRLMTYEAAISVDGAPWAQLADGEIKKVK